MAGDWYPDPTGRHEFRWYDGTWTEHVSDGVVTALDPIAEVPGAFDGQTGTLVLSASGRTTWFVGDDERVVGWGPNLGGELGDGTRMFQGTPVEPVGLRHVKALAAGGAHCVALLTDGTLRAWGVRDNGTIGDGDAPRQPGPQTVPVPVADLTGVVAISAHYTHSVALLADGSVWTWGENGAGQLGDGTIADRNRPVRAALPVEAVAVVAGGSHTVASTEDGSLWAWGDPTADLGRSRDPQPTPKVVDGLGDIARVACGGSHTVAVARDGTVWTWGLNDEGQLGDGTTTQRPQPLQVTGLPPVVDAAAGDWHTVVRCEDGTVWTWGGNSDGQLGDGGTLPRLVPGVVDALSGAEQISAGGTATVVRKDAQLLGCGNRPTEQGRTTIERDPVPWWPQTW